MLIEHRFPSFRGLDGKWEHHVRQSDLNDFRMCPEMKRQLMHGEAEKFDNDTAVIGTSAHAGFEALLGGYVDSLAEAVEVAQFRLTELWHSCRKVDVPDEETAREQLYKIIETFWNEVLEDLFNAEIVSVERKFDVLVDQSASRKIYLSGTSDVWCNEKIVDFKTSTKDWSKDEWKINRYNVQSTLYAWARDQIDIAPDRARKFTLDYANIDELYPVEFIVINRETCNVHRHTVHRTVADAKFLLKEIESFCNTIEYMPRNQWPLRPEDWFCSNKWCPAWMNCRGKFLGEDPWGLIERSAANQAKSVRPSSQVIEGLTEMRKVKLNG